MSAFKSAVVSTLSVHPLPCSLSHCPLAAIIALQLFISNDVSRYVHSHYRSNVNTCLPWLGPSHLSIRHLEA